MEEVIRSLEVDFDRDVLKVNGKEVETRVVTKQESQRRY